MAFLISWVSVLGSFSLINSVIWTDFVVVFDENCQRDASNFSKYPIAAASGSRNHRIWKILYRSSSESAFFRTSTISLWALTPTTMWEPTQSPMRFSMSFSRQTRTFLWPEVFDIGLFAWFEIEPDSWTCADALPERFLHVLLAMVLV